MTKHTTLTLRVPLAEYDDWCAEAERRHIEDVGQWLRILANFAIAAEVDGEPVASLGRRRRLAEVAMKCVNCGRGLGYKRTARKRYCSSTCRVEAWRMRQRAARARSKADDSQGRQL